MPSQNAGAEAARARRPRRCRAASGARPAVASATTEARSAVTAAASRPAEPSAGLVADDVGDRPLQLVGAAEVAVQQPPQVVDGTAHVRAVEAPFGDDLGADLRGVRAVADEGVDGVARGQGSAT